MQRYKRGFGMKMDVKSGTGAPKADHISYSFQIKKIKILKFGCINISAAMLHHKAIIILKLFWLEAVPIAVQFLATLENKM